MESSLNSAWCLAQQGLSKIFAYKQQDQHLWQELRAIRARFVHVKEKLVWSQERARRGPIPLDLLLTYRALCKMKMQGSLLISY